MRQGGKRWAARLRAGAIGVSLLASAGCLATPVDSTSTLSSPRPTPTSPAPPPASEPTATLPPSPSPTPAVMIAVGDIAGCESEGDEATAALVEGIPGTVAVLGDTVYPGGAPSEYAECYDPTWGRFRDRTRPAVGNHEYQTPGAAGYFSYFGDAAGPTGLGYYSYELGSWHIVVINSQCWEVGGCRAEDSQGRWLAADLEAHPAACTLAYWHVPRFSSGLHGGSDLLQAYWVLLSQAGAEIVLSGHDHDYERFAPQDSQGRLDLERGLRQFVVGTGGFGHYFFPGSPPANSEARDASTYGVLVLSLFERHYEWEYVPVAGGAFHDAGSGECHP